MIQGTQKSAGYSELKERREHIEERRTDVISSLLVEYGDEAVEGQLVEAVDRMAEEWRNAPTWLDFMQAEVHEWRRETVPRADDFDQAAHTAGEAQEVVDMYVKDKQYEETYLTSERIVDEAGDVFVSHLGYCSMVGLSAREAILEAFGKVNGDEWQGDRGL